MEEKIIHDNETLLAFWDQAFAIPEEEKQAARSEGAGNWEQMAPSEKLLRAVCGLGECRKVLDYGCGNGWAAVAAAKSGCEDVTAADAAPNAVSAAEFIAELCGVSDRVHPVLSAGDWLASVPAGTYDGLVISNVLDVVPPETAKELIAQAARAAAPGARVVIGLNYYLSPEAAEEKGAGLEAGRMLYVNGVLRLVSRSDDEWRELFGPYFAVESLEHFAWPGEAEERRRLFRLIRKPEANENE